MRYEDHLVDQVQAANDIVDVISQYIPLKRSGRNFKANCPFHQEKSPSFMVHPEKQIFHCFGCSAGGNVFGFLMRYENMTFPEALRSLAERAHIQLPEQRADKKGRDSSQTEQIYEIYRLATEYYHYMFNHPEKGRAAREYLKNRGFQEDLFKEFKLGWALPEWRGLYEFLRKKGFDDSLIQKAALIHRSSQGNYYDVFRGRVLFPIQNLQGKVIGFGGRIIVQDKEAPKYLNSPENPVFVKRKELFGLYLAKKFINRDKPQILIVEGYLDFMRLYAAGFKTAVATLGTALTEDHVHVLKRFAEEAIVVYDGDAAGQAASLRGLEIFLEGGMNVKLIRLPDGLDPDDFVRERGAEAFQKLIDSAKDFFDYKLESALSRHNRNDSLGVMKITNEFIETLAKVKSPILLSHYLRQLAAALRLDENSIRTELGKLQKKNADRETRFSGSFKPSAVLNSLGTSQNDEIFFLGLVIEDFSLLKASKFIPEAEDFEDPVARSLYRMILEGQETGAPVNWSKAMNMVDREDYKKKLLEVAAVDLSQEDKKKALKDCLKRLLSKRLQKKLDHIRSSITKAEQEGDSAQLLLLTQEYQTLIAQSKT